MDRDVEMDDMRVGTAPWVQRTAGRLTEAERRALLWPLARSHAQNAVGRLRFAVGLHPGRHATVLPARLAPPVTVLRKLIRANMVDAFSQEVFPGQPATSGGS